MAFPQSVLPVRVRIAPGGQPADPASWVWVDITQWVRVASGIVIEEGKRDEGARVDPGKCTLTLDNRDGRFSSRNVLGPWFEQLTKGTPLRVGTIALADTFTRTTSGSLGAADSGQAWSVSPTVFSTNGSAGQVSFAAANTAFAATAIGMSALDVDAQFTASVPAVMTGASQIVAILLRRVDGNNFYWMSCEFDTAGAITAKIRKTVASVITTLATASPVASLTYTPNQKMRIRAQVDGASLRVKVWADGGTEPSTWTATAIDSSIETAGGVGFYFWNVVGNSNAKPFSITFDDLEVEAIEYTGGVSEWPPRWDKSQRDATAPIVASGILRRLQQGKSPLRSPIVRMFVRNTPVAGWSLDDDSSATSAAPFTAGARAATVRLAEPGQDTPALAGAKQTTGITASTVISGQIPTHTATGKWGVVWFAYLPAPPAATTRIISIASTGTVRLWVVQLDATGMDLIGYDADGVQIFISSSAYTTGENNPPRWVAYDLLVEQVGGNVQGTFLKYGVNGTESVVMLFTSSTVAGTVGSPTSWSVQGSLGYNQGRLGPLAVFNVEPPFVTYDFSSAANGYAGETASARVTRLCAEEGVQVTVESGASERMGPQRTDTFLNLLYSCEDTDLGILHERGGGLGYRPRGARYNRPVGLALDFTPGDISEAPEPTDDDQQFRNQWTVSRDGGSFAVATDQSSIDAAGLLDDSATINAYTDSVLPDHASWRLAASTIDELRWPVLSLNMARNPAQVNLWRAAGKFPRVTVANEPAQVAGNEVDVTALGHTQTMTVKGWDIDLNCAPSAPYSEVAVRGTARRGSGSTRLTSATMLSSATHMVITTTNIGDCWSQTAVPYDIMVSGVRRTVLWMSGVDSVMSADGGFESGIGTWLSVGSTMTSSTSVAHTGTKSAQLVVTGSPSIAYPYQAILLPGPAGFTFTASAWMYSAAGASNARITISWYTNTPTFISSSSSSTVSLPAGVWTLVTVTATAPATSASALVLPNLTSSPPNGTTFNVDDVDFTLSPVTSPYVQHATVTLATNGITKDLAASAVVRLADERRYGL